METDQGRHVRTIINILDKIIENNKSEFRSSGSFKVRPGYGYDKFYLDWVDGSYDMSLHGLIHYIMYEKGIYKNILTNQQFKDLEKLIREDPEAIYGPDYDDENYDDLQELLDSIYGDAIAFVGEKLLSLGFDVKEEFSEYLGE